MIFSIVCYNSTPDQKAVKRAGNYGWHLDSFRCVEERL